VALACRGFAGVPKANRTEGRDRRQIVVLVDGPAVLAARQASGLPGSQAICLTPRSRSLPTS